MFISDFGRHVRGVIKKSSASLRKRCGIKIVLTLFFNIVSSNFDPLDSAMFLLFYPLVEEGYILSLQIGINSIDDVIIPLITVTKKVELELNKKVEVRPC